MPELTAGAEGGAPPLLPESATGDLGALREQVRTSVRDVPGVYQMRSANGEIMYVGKSKKLRTRLLCYFRAPYPEDKAARIVREAVSIEWTYTPSEFAALLEELRRIKRFRPRFNVAMKRDARNYAFVKLTRGRAPRFMVVRGAGADERATYYGPFVGAERLRDALRELSDALGLRDCSLDGRMTFSDQQDLFPLPLRTPGCLRYEIGKCTGPCVGAVREADYNARVREARAFLDGGLTAPMDRLREAMELASERMEFERAGALRDKIHRLEGLREQFGRLRFGVEALTFAYPVKGVEGDDRLYLVRRGRVRAELPFPRSGHELKAARELAAKVRAPDEQTQAIPGHEVDELLLLTSWFRTRPQELEKTVEMTRVEQLVTQATA
jgi:excinuclease ABC subunit C